MTERAHAGQQATEDSMTGELTENMKSVVRGTRVDMVLDGMSRSTGETWSPRDLKDLAAAADVLGRDARHQVVHERVVQMLNVLTSNTLNEMQKAQSELAGS